MSQEMLETAIVSRLRMLDGETFNRLPDAGGGVGDALYKAVREEPGLDSIAAAAKSRGCAMSRIRRMIMCAALGVTAGMTDGVPPYTRVLAVNGRGREILRAAAGTTDIPIVTKPADVRALLRAAPDFSPWAPTPTTYTSWADGRLRSAGAAPTGAPAPALCNLTDRTPEKSG
jgi:hypothetical protein